MRSAESSGAPARALAPAAPEGFAWRAAGGVLALVAPALERAGFVHGFATRLGGVSALPRDALDLGAPPIDVPLQGEDAARLAENRRRFLALFPGEWRLASGRQVHGERAVLVDPDGRVLPEECDALATRAPGVLVGVRTADCVPLLIGDGSAGACAAVHAGWRGALAGVATRALERLAALGARPERAVAVLGPAALRCCYEVGPDVAEPFAARCGDAVTPGRAGARDRLDLHAALRAELLAGGLAPERVLAAPLCTLCRNGLFFSHRREAARGAVGRSLAVVGRAAS
jgi:YfiH family protein